MEIVEKNLSQDEFMLFYNYYVHNVSKPNLAAWIIRIIPEEDLKKLLEFK